MKSIVNIKTIFDEKLFHFRNGHFFHTVKKYVRACVFVAAITLSLILTDFSKFTALQNFVDVLRIFRFVCIYSAFSKNRKSFSWDQSLLLTLGGTLFITKRRYQGIGRFTSIVMKSSKANSFLALNLKRDCSEKRLSKFVVNVM